MTPVVDYPQGWSYDPADPSVGLFAEGWVHDDCPVESIVVKLVEPELIYSHHIKGGALRMLVTTSKLTCPDCQQSAVFDDEEWDPEGMEDD